MSVMEVSSRALGRLAAADEYWAPIDLGNADVVQLASQVRSMILIRCAEERIGEGVESGVIKCPCHLVIGQEAPAVALAGIMQPGDKVFGAHRSHAHYLSLGGDLRQLFAEVLGKETGCSKGMGGSMHLIDRAHHLFGTVPIVGATIPIAAGAALAAKMDGRGGVAVSFLGDGATEEGVFHETLNLASVFKLPLLFVVENNFFSSHLHISLRQPFDSICRFAEAHGVPWQRVDGNDVVELNAAATSAIEGARAGRGPALIEAVTYRWRGHVGHREDNDVGVQRQENLMHWRQRDPIQRVVNALVAAGATAPDAMDALWTECRQAVADAWTQAVADPYPEPSALLSRVFSGGGR